MGWREFTESKVGDKITINRWGGAGHRQQPYEFRTLTRVTKTSVTDDKGWRWTINGDQWGRTNSFTSHGISASRFKEEHEKDNVEIIRDANHRAWRGECDDTDWSKVPIENVKLIRAILRWKGPKPLIMGDMKVVPNP